MKTFAGSSRNLRFSLAAGFVTPIVVYKYSVGDDGIDYGGRVVGESCNTFFNPYDRGLFAGTGAGCPSN